MNLQRTAAIFRMHAYDVLRRRLVLALLVILPLALYATIPEDPKRPGFEVVFIGTLMTFSIAGPAIFIMLGGRDIDPRLGLSGFKPLELVIGRFLLLGALGVATAIAFGLVVMVVESPKHPVYLFAGLVLIALLAAVLGLACGATLPGDLEAMLVMIGIVGMQLVAAPSSPVHRVMPYRAPILLLFMATGQKYNVLEIVGLTVFWFSLLIMIAFITIRRRGPVVIPTYNWQLKNGNSELPTQNSQAGSPGTRPRADKRKS